MASTSQVVVPFNFYAGAMPSSDTDLAYVDGWDYIITAITLSLPASDGAVGLTLVDADGHTRWYNYADGTGDTAAPHIAESLYLVMGPNAGAAIHATAAAGWCSIDGLALLPIGSTIVVPDV